MHIYGLISRESNSSSKVEHDEKLTELLYEMRKDLNIRPKDKSGDWQANLWSSRVKKPAAGNVSHNELLSKLPNIEGA